MRRRFVFEGTYPFRLCRLASRNASSLDDDGEIDEDEVEDVMTHGEEAWVGEGEG